MKSAAIGVLILIACTAKVANAQVSSSSDSTLVSEALSEYQERVRYGFLVDPFSVYSSTYGFGIRALATLYNLPFTGSRLRATLRPYQRRGVYGLTLRSHDPLQDDVFALLRFRYETNGAYRFYGLGAGTQEKDRLFVDMERLQALVRVGVQFADDRFMIQPFAQYVWDEVGGLDEDDDPSTLDDRSQRNLAFAMGTAPTQAGVSDNVHSGFKVGLSLVADFRNRLAYPTSGARMSITGLHYTSQDDFDTTFDQLSANGQLFLGLGGEHVIALRVIADITDDNGDDPIPFFLLPEVDFSVLGGYKGHRLVDYDRLVLNAEYRWPVVNLADLYQVSGFVQVGAGNVFEDIADMKMSVTFDKDVDPTNTALRPGFGVGLRVAALEQGRDLIYWMLGFGPEGVTLAAFRFVHSLTDIQ